LQEAIEVFDRRSDIYNAAAAKLALGNVRETLGQPAEAQRLFLAALQDFQAAGDQHGSANAIASLGLLELAHGDQANAAQLLEHALAVLTALEDHPSVARTMNNLAIAEVRRGRAQEAIGHWTRCRDLYLEMGDPESADGISRRIEEYRHDQAEQA
jgi:tetratricopeptide (TPR) repeat protein